MGGRNERGRERASSGMNEAAEHIIKRSRPSGGPRDTPVLEMGGVGVCMCVHIVLYWSNKPSICGGDENSGCKEQGGGGCYGTLYSPYLHPFSNAQTDGHARGPAQRFFDACRYRCVMMSYGRQRKEGGMIKGERGGMKKQERISKTTTGQRWRLLMPRDVHRRLDLCIGRRRPARAASGLACLVLTG